MFLIFLPLISAEEFELLGCEGTADLGTNSKEPFLIVSDDCIQISVRRFECQCHDDKVIIFSEDHITEYDLIFQYEDGVKKTKRWTNFVFQEAYSNPFKTGVLVWGLSVFVGAIIIPVSILIWVGLKNGKDR